MIARPCNISARCNPCAEDSSPYENLSAEAPDPINYIAMAFYRSIPCENGGCEQDPCVGSCVIPPTPPTCPWCIIDTRGKGKGDTQDQANTNARNDAQQQSNDAQGKPTFWNAAYGGNIPCPGGGSSQYDIPAGTYSGNSQAEADALAQSNFDQLAYANLICITTTSVPSTCTDGGEYNQTLAAYGGITIELGHYVWEISAGSLPPGFTLDAISGLINGDPNTSVPGTYDFTVTVSDDLSNNASKDFSISIVSISPTATDLPDATNGTSYIQQLTIDPPTLTGTFSITVGALPTDMSMDATGLISGTPSSGGAFSITVSVVVESIGLTCSKTYTLDCWSYTSKDSSALTVSTAGDTSTGAIGGVAWAAGKYQLRFKTAGTSPMAWYEKGTGPPENWVNSLGGTEGDCTAPAIILKANGTAIGNLIGYTMSDPSSSAVSAADCMAAMQAANVLIEFTLTSIKTLTLTWPKLTQPICPITLPATSITAPSGTGLVTSLYVLA